MVPPLGKAVYAMDFTNSIVISSKIPRVSLVAQLVKNLPAMQETWIRTLSWEEVLMKEMAAQDSILAWRISWMEEPGQLRSMGLQELDTTE